VASNFTYK